MSSHEISYLLLGHVTQDLTPTGVELGGTATYSSLTACALGHPVRLITSYPQDFQFPSCTQLEIKRTQCDCATQFENIMVQGKRKQFCYSQAKELIPDDIPPTWKQSNIIHFGPVAQEISLKTIRGFPPDAFLCATPQGWMRSWDKEGLVHPVAWEWAAEALPLLKAVVLSMEDVGGDEKKIDELVRLSKILVITEAEDGARVYWKGDARYFPAPHIPIADSTGAGDIFAAVFFSRLYITKDPWAAAKVAVQLASLSISRKGLASIPTTLEINQKMVEIIKQN
ncbi:MAG TPA: hypothetical protein DCK95_10995 [Anaerolineaceae bacterium]|uniref:Carbohydrate kinase PfkB domain-containing protein n=1 Tax=Anaerolinea thermophila TaxID=167964 RepID=A0A124FN03_9CHLR|nr:MAG: hypothetical protein XD73_0722 [Anaerolinea thermophila]HAF62833.1 hypothetical protein [Anaerolineaceae bacterium]